jgi:hypothetical protein
MPPAHSIKTGPSNRRILISSIELYVTRYQQFEHRPPTSAGQYREHSAKDPEISRPKGRNISCFDLFGISPGLA